MTFFIAVMSNSSVRQLNMDIQTTLGLRIRRLREARGITQEELAYLANTQTSHISRIELGQNNTTIDVAHRIAQALQIDLSDLLNLSSEDVDLIPIDEHIMKVAAYMKTAPEERHEQIVQIVKTFVEK